MTSRWGVSKKAPKPVKRVLGLIKGFLTQCVLGATDWTAVEEGTS